MVSMACVVGCFFGLVCAGAGIWAFESRPECRTGVALGGCVVVGSEHFDLYCVVEGKVFVCSVVEVKKSLCLFRKYRRV